MTEGKRAEEGKRAGARDVTRRAEGAGKRETALAPPTEGNEWLELETRDASDQCQRGIGIKTLIAIRTFGLSDAALFRTISTS